MRERRWEFSPSHVYRIRTRSGQQKNEREHVLTFLAEDPDGSLSFNARPFAGTQTLRREEITSVFPLGKSAGREDQRHTMNKVIR